MASVCRLEASRAALFAIRAEAIPIMSGASNAAVDYYQTKTRIKLCTINVLCYQTCVRFICRRPMWLNGVTLTFVQALERKVVFGDTHKTIEDNGT